MKLLTAFIAGLLFAIGLSVGGMTDPRKIIGFLDVAGHWDPSLAFVMGGAILAYAPLFRFVTRKPRPLLATKFHLPTRRDVDTRLIVGASLFGIGWGLGGFCPGPALVSTMSFASDAFILTGSMVLGMAGFAAWQSFTRNRGVEK